MTRKVLNKKVKKTIAVAMSTMLVMSSSSFHVLADTPTQTATDSNATVTITFGTGTLEDPEVTTTTITETDNTTGNTSTTTEIVSSATGTDDNGATITQNKDSYTTAVVDSDGKPVSAHGGESGTETTSKTETSTNTTTSSEVTDTTVNTETTEGKPVYNPEPLDTETTGPVTTTTTPEINTNLNGTTVTVTTTEPTKTEIITPTVDWNLPDETDADGDTVTEDGKEITTIINYIEDDNGNVIGYTTTKTTTTTVDGTSETTTDTTTTTTEPTVTGSTTTTDTTTTLTPPGTLNKPTAVPPETDINGNTSVTTVTDLLDDNGNVIGYTVSSIVTDKDGNIISASAETVTVEGKTTTITTTSTTTTSKEKTTVTTKTTTTDVGATIITETTTTYLPDVTAGSVTATLSTVTEDGTNGEVTTESITPDSTILNAIPEATINKDLDLYHRPDSNIEFNSGVDAPVGYDFQWEGEYGQESLIRINTTGTGSGDDTYQAHQFVLVDNDDSSNLHYVYCADFEVGPESGFYYKMENLEDAAYYNDAQAKSIRAIALNGYWGTTGTDENGAPVTGSLQAVKNMLKAAGNTGLTDAEIDSMTEGEALAATQAAIWVFGNSGVEEDGSLKTDSSDKINIDDPVGAYYNKGSGLDTTGANWPNPDETSEKIVKALFDYLIHLTAEPEETSFIDTDNFSTSASITVNDTVKNADGTKKKDADGNDIYNASVDFSLLVVPDETNDDLLVMVIVDGKTIETRRLAGTNDEGESYQDISTKIDSDGNKIYTIENLELAEGVKVTLNLEGTQHISKGVYIYTSEVIGNETSQTFVGIAEGTRDVNLNVDLTFSVTEPDASIRSTSSKETKELTGTRTDVSKETKVETIIEVTTEIVTEDTTETLRSWATEWEAVYEAVPESEDPTTPTDPDKPKKNDKPEKTEEPKTSDKPEVLDAEDISEPETAVLGAYDELMAVAPATGDTSTLWTVLTALSGLLLSGFNFFDKKRKKHTLK